MSAYRPASATQLTIPLGPWTAAGKPTRTAVMEVDPRLFTWLVNAAAKQPKLTTAIALGTPALRISLT
jgi:hypothetical protein